MLLDVVRRWATGRADLRAVALVGSWARGDARAGSDVDVVLLTDDPAAYVDDEWMAPLGAKATLRTKQWGQLTERRAALASGLEVEFGVVSPVWASTDPLDAGTRRVVAGGLVALYDPDDLLRALVDAVASQRS